MSDTSRTDAKHIEVQMQDLQIGHQLRELINFARQLERELDEARTRGDTYGQKYAACILEREKLKAELRQMSVCLDASNTARSMLGNERDTLKRELDEANIYKVCARASLGQLRKVCDAYYVMLTDEQHDKANELCSPLPHVIERKTK